MADFVAVLRKTIDALGENTPEMRDKVFDKARATIEAKLKAIQPPPPPAVVERQRKALEDAIAVIKADYAAKAPEKDETLEDIFASLKSIGDAKPAAPAAQAPQSPAPAAAQPERKPSESVAAKVDSAPRETAPPSPRAAPAPTPDPVLDVATAPVQGPPTEDGEVPVALAPVVERRRPKVPSGLIAAAIAFVVVAAGGYGVWINRDDLAPLVGLGAAPQVEEGASTTAADLAPPPADEELAAEVAAPQATPDASPAAEAEEQIASLPPADEPAAVPDAAPASSDEPAKFTQRLLPDGSEVDEGPASGPERIGEGTSLAAATQPEAGQTATDASPDSGDVAQAGPAGATANPAQPASQSASVAVGQKAIFYEERTTSASGSAEAGSIVWSLVEESPGGDLPPEPAIRAQATIPGKDIQLRMTIRRNGDRTLPASHIIEMIFLTPEGFEGGGIANVSRVSFKETEQATGNALIGIPAKIADGFFLIALGDAPAEVETNITLLRRQSWIDIPITYQSGRRALLSMEKGIPGDKVFQEALRAWAETSSG